MAGAIHTFGLILWDDSYYGFVDWRGRDACMRENRFFVEYSKFIPEGKLALLKDKFRGSPRRKFVTEQLDQMQKDEDQQLEKQLEADLSHNEALLRKLR